ncbi:hypothetical protein NL676_013979 [Syzygium grande]|nr:hypothetical protein NL676_013979 [Syzygium grande]
MISSPLKIVKTRSEEPLTSTAEENATAIRGDARPRPRRGEVEIPTVRLRCRRLRPPPAPCRCHGPPGSSRRDRDLAAAKALGGGALAAGGGGGVWRGSWMGRSRQGGGGAARKEKMSLAIIPSLVFVLALLGTAEPRKLSYRWEVKLVLDANNVEVIAVNGKTSIPTIRAQLGDTIDVEVRNGLEDELKIYWQGIQQGVGRRCNGTGAPILPEQAGIYCLVANQAGKFLYQSEYKSQRDAGLNGDPEDARAEGGRGIIVVDDDGGIRLVLGHGAVAGPLEGGDNIGAAGDLENAGVEGGLGIAGEDYRGLGIAGVDYRGLGLVLGPRGAAARVADDLNGGVVSKRGSAVGLALGGAEERREKGIEERGRRRER